MMTLWDRAGTDPLAATVLLLYVGPDQILPLTSALGAIVGVILLFWQRVVVIIGKLRHWILHRVLRRPETPLPPPKAAKTGPSELSATASGRGEKR